ncbi:hypothetical protein N800_07645 [Lysobacter daejeonensis GH1-9]|uniref:diguanylate cyclase n=1 Tax=Lysobacter daejeonensis GH1-9 TaxID=1385517 RepID=A0A0A0ER13_9GAMM|nr:hypothetical protein N800_07645 [Lysobacter daejeonensis GH1-9]
MVHTLLCLLIWLGWFGGACASPAAPLVSGLPGGLAGVPMTRQFSAEDFGASPQHLALSTDADGRLLVGNVDGLLRFDGETWRLFELPTRSAVRSIAVGADRRLYIGSYDTFGWMEPDGDGGLVYRDLLDAAGLRGEARRVGVVWDVLPAPSGVYFRSDHALHFLPYRGERARTWPLPAEVRGFFVDGDVLFARVEGQGFSRFVEGRFVPEPGADVFAHRGLPEVFPRRDWRLLLGVDGFYRADRNGITLIMGDGGAAFAGTGAYTAVELDDGSLVVGTHSGELFRYDSDLKLRLRMRLGSYGVQALGTDGEDGLWVATEVGLHRLSVPSPWSVIGSAQGVKGRIFDFEWFDGALWLATSRGVARLQHDAAGNDRYEAKDWVTYEANSLVATTRDLLVGHRDGLLVYRRGAARPIPLLTIDGGVYALLQSQHDPGLVFAFSEPALYLLREIDGHWVVWRQFPTDGISTWGVEESARGELWFGDTRGYPQRWRLDLDAGTLLDKAVFGRAEGLAADVAEGSNIYLLDGRVHTVVGGQGYRFDGRRFVPDAGAPFSLVDRPKELTVRETPMGAYAYTARQLWHRARRNGPWTQIHLSPDTAGGYGMLRVNADGALRISTWKGLVQYDPTEHTSVRQPLRVGIESISARRARTAPASGVAVAAEPLPSASLPVPRSGQVLDVAAGNSLNLRFSMVSMESGAQFRYRVHGVSSDWSSWNNAVLVVRPLPAGLYRVEVEGRTRAGREAEPLTLAFRVLPFWYETWWARLLGLLAVALAGTALVFALIRLRTRQYLATNRELEQRIAERTFALEDANRQLTELATEDPLTGIANRRVLETGLRREWNRCVANGQPLSALMIDVDHFKKFNDDHGHLEGDHTLRQVAELLHAHHDEERELLARYGGEEFSLLLPGVDVEQARQRAEALRATVAASPLGVTVSVGVAGFVPTRNAERDGLLRRADGALYRAKRGGRNRVEVDGD